MAEKKPKPGKPRRSKHDGAKFGPKFTTTEREKALAEVEELDGKGWSQLQIAERMNLSQPQVCVYLKKIRERYREHVLESRDERVAEKLRQLRKVRKEAWEAWDRSSRDSHRVVEEMGLPFKKDKADEGKTERSSGKKMKAGEPGDDPLKNTTNDLIKIKTIITREGRLPASQYLDIVMKTLDMECKLLSLYEVDQVVQGSGVNLWDLIQGRPDRKNEVEARLEEEERKALPRVTSPVQSETVHSNGKHEEGDRERQ